MGARTWIAGLGLLAAGAAGAGWYVSATGGVVVAPDWCERTDAQLAIGYTHGVGDSVHVSFDHRGEGDLIVSVRTRSGGGAHTMQGLMGEARFALPRSDSTVYSPDGRELDCSRVPRDELGALTAPRGPR